MRHFYLLTLLIIFSLNAQAQKKILIITGGHNFEKTSFYEMFDSFSEIQYDTIAQPKANELLTTKAVNEYDCIVFYDMFQAITEAQKTAYLTLLDRGIGLVFTHHALVSYQNWPEFEKIIGGKYHLEASANHPASTYRHDVDFTIKISDPNHPITQGIKDFNIHDEVYGSYSVSDHVKPLLTTDHPESSPTIGWHHTNNNSRIVYIQLGHDHHAYENLNYRLLIQRAIDWASTSP